MVTSMTGNRKDGWGTLGTGRVKGCGKGKGRQRGRGKRKEKVKERQEGEGRDSVGGQIRRKGVISYVNRESPLVPKKTLVTTTRTVLEVRRGERRT